MCIYDFSKSSLLFQLHPQKNTNNFAFIHFMVVFTHARRGLQRNQFMKWKEDIELVLSGLFPCVHNFLKTKKAKIKYGMTEHGYSNSIWKLLQDIISILSKFVVHTLHDDHVEQSIHKNCCLLYLPIYYLCMGNAEGKEIRKVDKRTHLTILPRLKVYIPWKLEISNAPAEFHCCVTAASTNDSSFQFWSQLPI